MHGVIDLKIDIELTRLQIKAVAAYSGLSLDLAQGYVHYQDNKTPEFLAKFASGKIPAFESSTGFTLFESKAIARYSESPLRNIPHHPLPSIDGSGCKGCQTVYPCLNHYVETITWS